jgi:hypothetical protein
MFLAIAATAILNAQKAPLKYGDVSMDELKMTVYPYDTSAAAVVLFDYGFFRASNIEFTRTMRIKILKKEGYGWANHVFPTNPNTSVRGITSNLVDGELVQDKLKKESTYTERVTNQIYRLRIAMPNVKVGSVIDLEFTFRGIPSTWRFQENIPEKYNELNLEISPMVKFRTTFSGFERLTVSTPDRWIANNMPALKPEPFMNSEENSITKLSIDLLEIVNYHMFAATWDNVFQDLMYEDKFGKALDLSGYLNDLAKKIKQTGQTGQGLMKAAYDSIRTAMKWNEVESYETSNPTLGIVYKKRTGNSADINLMLLQLLKKLDIKAVPVVLSTRSNGIMSSLVPSYSRFNYDIVEANISGVKYLLDATETYLPYYMLPFRCLNYNGRTALESGSMGVDLTPNRFFKKVTMYNVALSDETDLTGDMTVINTDYAALEFRKKYHTFNSTEEYVDDLKKEKVGLTVVGSEFENIDSIYKPAIEKYRIRITGSVNQAGSELYVVPFLFEQLAENPFRAIERKSPVDFGYRTDRTVITTVRIPEGYTVSALPANIVLKMPDNSATFIFNAVSLGSEIKITGRFSIGKVLFTSDQYLDLREFYDQMVKKQNEPIIFKKN